MSTKPRSHETVSFPGFAESQAFWQSASQQAEVWLKGQPEIVAKYQAAAQNWMVHRQEDFTKAVETYKQMSECKDFGKAAAIQQAWFAGCVQGLVADWMVLMDPMTDGSRRHSKRTKEGAIAVTKVPQETSA